MTWGRSKVAGKAVEDLTPSERETEKQRLIAFIERCAESPAAKSAGKRLHRINRLIERNAKSEEQTMPRIPAKYKTLAELLAARQRDELPPDAKLVLDNDYSYMYAGNECLYRGGGPKELVEEALDLLELPWEYC